MGGGGGGRWVCVESGEDQLELQIYNGLNVITALIYIILASVPNSLRIQLEILLI